MFQVSRAALSVCALTLGAVIALTGVRARASFLTIANLEVNGSGTPASLALADVNGDGAIDVITGTCTAAGHCDTVTVSIGAADGMRDTAAFPAGGDGANAIAVADVNRDGALDLVVANRASDTIGILLGNARGAFQPPIQLSALTEGSSGPAAVTAADVNRDGYPDIVVANERASHDLATPIGVWLGTGDGTFGRAIGYASGGYAPASVSVADVNNDRVPDIVALNSGGDAVGDRGTVAVLIGVGDGSFHRASTHPTTVRHPHTAALADLNGDKSPDVVVGGGETSALNVLLGRPDGTLAAPRAIDADGAALAAPRSHPLTIAEVNGDGRADLLIGSCFGLGCPSEIQVLTGDGTGGFQRAAGQQAGIYGVGLIAAADLNGDGTTDPVVATCSQPDCSASALQVLAKDAAPESLPFTSSAQSAGAASIESATLAAEPDEPATPGVSMPGAGTYNIRLVTDASPDLTDLGGLVHSTTSRWTSTRERVWALFYWSHILKRQTAPIVRHGFEVTDPIRNFADYGFTMCSTISGINQTLYERLGLRHQYWDICNHTVSAVEYDNKFRMVDSSMSHLVTTDGVNLASVPEAAADSAWLVRNRSLYSTSPNGFLTGSDTARNLSEITTPSGSVLRGFADAFCATGLKYRDYYYNWNSGHRYVLNLREDESYTRYYRRLGASNAYWVGSEKISSPDPNVTFEIDAENRFGIRGNGRWTFTPALSPTEYAQAIYTAQNIAPLPAGGLTIETPGTGAEVVYKVQAANAIASQRIDANFRRTDALASATFRVSINHGATWTQVGVLGSAIADSVPVTIALRDQVNGANETLLKVEMADGGSAGAIALTSLSIETITQVNTKALPKLNVGRNEIYLGAGEQSDTMVLFPDLRGTLWQRDAYASANIATQGVSVPRKFTAVAYPSSLLNDAHLTYRMDAPTDITRVVYGGRLFNYKDGSYIDFLHSFDGGATWIRSFRLTDANLPHDDIHYETVTDIPAGVRTVLFRYLIHNTSTEVSRASGLYSVRMEVNHRPRNSAPRPVDVTWRWKEVRADRTLVERSHRQRINEFPFKYVVNVGGHDHPVMESVSVSVESDRDVTPFGYSDGIDAGGAKYVHTKRTDGTNLAKGRPYTFSRAPSGFQSSAGATNSTILTDGVVGAPSTGGTTYWWGQCWTSGTAVDLQVDLGAERAATAFRAHLLGYPGWDAFKGQVQDRVEVFTSLDGINYTSQGLLQTSLWRKDVPINHMLPDDERATAWNFERLVSAPVSARYIRYRLTPRRDLCVTELQVLDSVQDEPFDIRIALPLGGGTPQRLNLAPEVGLTAPDASGSYTAPATVTVAAAAVDRDGSIARVEFFAGATLIGTAVSSPFTMRWLNVPEGAHTLTARAVDNEGASTMSAPVTITVQPSKGDPVVSVDEVVLHAAAQGQVLGGWAVVQDASAAGGALLQNPDTAQPKLSTPLAAPLQAFDLTFTAEAGKAYRLWLRAKAFNNSYTNDSVFVQFDGSVDVNGTSTWRIGSTSATTVILEDCGGCGLSEWGWADNGYGANVLGPLVYFAESGPQRLRIQMREDGMGIDQVVLSAFDYRTSSPGATKNDTTVLARTPTVQPPANSAPAVTLTAPVPATTLTAPATVNVEAVASDSDGTITRVDFFAGPTLIGTATQAPFATTWSGVPAGTYQLTAVAFDDDGASTRSSAVAITVEPPAPPANTPPTIAITAPIAGAVFTAPASIAITADAADADGTVARVEFYADATRIGSATTAPFALAWDAVPEGTYSVTARATDDAGATTISSAVTITVESAAPPPNVAPTIALTAPSAGATFTAPASVTIAANAADSDGTIARVEFYADAALIGSATTAPFQATWEAAPAGSYAITARATDDAGATTTSSAITITVESPAPPPNAAPTIALTAPSAGATFTAPASVTVAANAADSDGTIARVEFYAEATLIGSATTAPFQATWEAVPAGNYAITARATDDAGATTTSSAVMITVDAAAPPPNAAPTIALTAPSTGATFTAPASVTIAANAADSDGTIARVEFYAGTTLVGTATSTPFTVVWADVAEGTYVLTARASDNAGASTTSAAVSISVQRPPAQVTANEIVLHAARQAQITGGWSVVADSTAAGGARLQNADNRQEKLVAPLPAPSNAFELSFTAEAGKGYRLWLRGRAIADSYKNDSVFVQFDRSVTATGTPTWRMNTTSATTVSIEDCSGCGLRGWGWADNAYGLNALGSLVYFETSGPQRLRIQVREDGVAIDQVVLSAVAYRTAAPGATKDDTTILTATTAGTERVNAAPTVALTAPGDNATFVAPASIAVAANASDADGSIARVDFFAGTTLIGSATASPFAVTWSNVPAGAYALTAHATDDAGAVTMSASRSITVQPPAQSGSDPIDEIVIHAAPAAQVVGGWSVVPDATAASGSRLQNPNPGQAKLATPLAEPTLAFEVTFTAEAGKTYRLWLRGKAISNSYNNDSVFVQFDGTIDGSGAPIWRSGTTSATTVILEDCSGCGLSEWGWADNGYGTNVLGPLVSFAQSGPQRLRIQAREDGLGIDQIVLSAVKYRTAAPGATRDDTTILPD